jgi:DnaA family protein
MTQLVLDLHRTPDPTLANFVAGRNVEALACLAALAAGDRAVRFVYLWGAAGCGRSHLLRSLGAGGRYVPAGSPARAFDFDPAIGVHAVDDVDALDGASQEALFHLFNRVLADPSAALVCAGDRAPLALGLREDLRTRLGWGLVYELRLLSDEEKAAALARAAAERGVAVAPDVIPWLLTHRSRDIRALLAAFDALDRYAYERRRPITLALAREWLQRGLGDDLDPTAADDKIPS